MNARKRRISLRSWAKIAGWTVFGTLACVLVSVSYNYATFRHLGTEALGASIASAVVLPIVLAGPLFFYLTIKLRELAITNRRLATLAATDGLTGCLNRSAFSTRVGDWLADPLRATQPGQGALLVIDADHFKQINDNHGHEHGDVALKMIAEAIKSCTRGGDLVGRLGGEEFGVFLPGVTDDVASGIAERIRSRVNTASIEAGRAYALTVSVGCATFAHPLGFADLFRIADTHLYVAKQSGRNQVIVADASRHARAA